MKRVVAVWCAGLVILSACGGGDGSSVDGTTIGSSTTGPGASVSTAFPTAFPTATTAPTTGALVVAATTAASPAAPTTTRPTSVPASVPTKPPKSQPTTTVALVSFSQFSVTLAGACAAPDVSTPVPAPTVQISWKLTGVIPDDVYVAVENVDGPYTTGLPTQGTFELNYPCDGNEHTYYVVAVIGTEKVSKSKKV